MSLVNNWMGDHSDRPLKLSNHEPGEYLDGCPSPLNFSHKNPKLFLKYLAQSSKSVCTSAAIVAALAFFLRIKED